MKKISIIFAMALFLMSCGEKKSQKVELEVDSVSVEVVDSLSVEIDSLVVETDSLNVEVIDVL